MHRQYNMSRDTEIPPIQEDQVVERHRETNMLTSRDPSLEISTVPITVSIHCHSHKHSHVLHTENTEGFKSEPVSHHIFK